MGVRLRVGIVGGGVAGLAAAAFLARGGNDVTLFEQAGKIGPVGAGLLLQPSGQGVLRELGLLEEVVARAERVEALHARQPDGRDLIHLRYDEYERGVCGYGVHRAELIQPLIDEVYRRGVRCCIGQAIDGVGRTGGRAEEGAEEGAEGRTGGGVTLFGRDEAVGEFDLVVIADGSRSRLRGKVFGGEVFGGLGVKVHAYGPSALWVTAHCPGVRGKLLQCVRGTKRLAGLLPIGGGRCSMFWGVRRGEKQRMLERGFDAWRQECVGLCPEAEELFGEVRSFEQVVFAEYQHVSMGRWRSGPVVAVGDAAHSMSPHFGQGVNLALLDAYWLAKVVGEGPGLAGALERYEGVRRAHVRLYASLSWWLTPYFQGEGVLKGVARDVGLPLMTRVPVLRRRMVQTMAGMRPSISGFGSVM